MLNFSGPVGSGTFGWVSLPGPVGAVGPAGSVGSWVEGSVGSVTTGSVTSGLVGPEGSAGGSVASGSVGAVVSSGGSVEGSVVSGSVSSGSVVSVGAVDVPPPGASTCKTSSVLRMGSSGSLRAIWLRPSTRLSTSTSARTALRMRCCVFFMVFCLSTVQQDAPAQFPDLLRLAVLHLQENFSVAHLTDEFDELLLRLRQVRKAPKGRFCLRHFVLRSRRSRMTSTTMAARASRGSSSIQGWTLSPVGMGGSGVEG